jgi:pimeloyl-ACP methyl ester carboxylesterase
MTNFVLVHGGLVGGWYWSEVAQRLEKAGHRVEVIEQLPSAGPDPAVLGDLAADVEVVKQAVERVGEPVVLVGHSYGGMVITELADHPFGRPQRLPRGGVATAGSVDDGHVRGGTADMGLTT